MGVDWIYISRRISVCGGFLVSEFCVRKVVLMLFYGLKWVFTVFVGCGVTTCPEAGTRNSIDEVGPYPCCVVDFQDVSLLWVPPRYCTMLCHELD